MAHVVGDHRRSQSQARSGDHQVHAADCCAAGLYLGGHVVDPNAPEQQRLTDRDENPTPRRWPQAQYLEAIEYYCRKFGLKGVDPYKVSGIPDPKSITPKMWIERGLPYMLYIERDPPKLGPPRKPFIDEEEVY